MKHVAMILAAIILITAATGCLAQVPRPEQPASSESRADGSTPTPGPAPEPVPPAEQIQAITPDFSAAIAEKKAENPDVVGWLRVPGTTIDDPILLNPEEEYDYYLTHDFTGAPDRNGTFCADYRCTFTPGTREGISRNTTLYGHNWTEDPEGELFDQLKKFKDPEFARASPYVYFSTGEENMAWEIFAVYDTHVDFPYILPDLPADAFQEVVRGARQASLYDYDVQVSPEDKVLTLSTCTFNVPGQGGLPLDQVNSYRFVVMARLMKPGERAEEKAVLTASESFLAPEEMPMVYNPEVDAFLLAGQPCYLYNPENWNIEMAADPKKAVRVGEIRRTGILYSLQDGDATRLPVGTAIYNDPDFPAVFFAQAHGQMLPYIAQKDSYEMNELVFTLENDGSVLKEKRFTRETDFTELQAQVDKMGFTRLTDSENAIKKQGDTSIRAVSKDGIAAWTQVFMKAVPASLGREVLVASQSGEWYYTDAGNYDTLLQVFD